MAPGRAPSPAATSHHFPTEESPMSSLRFKSLGLAAAVLLGLSPSLFAQVGRGNVYGTVVDETGALMPGATVELSSEYGTQTTTTSTEGAFRFLGVDQGQHTLTVTLTGFAGVTREVTVTSGTNIELTFTLNVAQIQETVNVTAETPIVDTKKLGTDVTITRDELSRIPSAREPWALMRTVPGILVDRVNIAGSESGQQSAFFAKGADAKDQVWTLDGVNVTDEVSWSSPGYWQYDTFDEINFTTGGSDVSIATGGVGINIVTKRGTNAFHGGAGGFYAGDEAQWSNLPDELQGDPRLLGNDKADHADRITDLSFDLGGPILKDRLWFYLGYGRNDIRVLRLTQTEDRTLLENYTAKLNWQASSKDMISLFWFQGEKGKFGRASVSLQEEDSHLWDQGGAYKEGFPRGFSKLEWDRVFGPSFILNTKLSYYNNGFGLHPRSGLDTREYQDFVNQVAYGSNYDISYLRPQWTGSMDARYFKGSHELRFGGAFRRTGHESIRTQPADRVQIRFYSDGNQARFFRDGVVATRTNHLSFYAGDTWTRDRLTINAALRFDRQTAFSLPTSALANPAIPDLMPSLDYPGSDGNVVEWNNLTPRLGVTFALDEARKTVLRASFARYAGTLPTASAGWTNPVATSYMQYPWTDFNGDGDMQIGEVDFAATPTTGNFDPENPTAAESPNQVDPDYSANIDNEIVVGIDHELVADLAVSLAYTWRRSSDLTSQQLLSAYYWYNWIGDTGTFTSADFVAQDPVTQNGFTATSYLPTADAEARMSWGALLCNRPGFHRGFNGLELGVTKRMSHGWMGRLAFSLNDWSEHVAPEGIQNPTRHTRDPLDDGGQVAPNSSGSGKIYFTNARWLVNANALYELPLGFEIAGNLFGRQGYPNPYYLTLDSGFDGYLSVLADGHKIDDTRLPALWNLDLRLAKTFRFGESLRLNLSAEMFNVFNSSTELNRVHDASSDVFNRLDEILAPRIVRFGARVSF
jgi:hypothetical protein